MNTANYGPLVLWSVFISERVLGDRAGLLFQKGRHRASGAGLGGHTACSQPPGWKGLPSLGPRSQLCPHRALPGSGRAPSRAGRGQEWPRQWPPLQDSWLPPCLSGARGCPPGLDPVPGTWEPGSVPDHGVSWPWGETRPPAFMNMSFIQQVPEQRHQCTGLALALCS